MDGRKEAFAGDQRRRKDETKRKEGGNELDTEVSLYIAHVRIEGGPQVAD